MKRKDNAVTLKSDARSRLRFRPGSPLEKLMQLVARKMIKRPTNTNTNSARVKTGQSGRL